MLYDESYYIESQISQAKKRIKTINSNIKEEQKKFDSCLSKKDFKGAKACISRVRSYLDDAEKVCNNVNPSEIDMGTVLSIIILLTSVVGIGTFLYKHNKSEKTRDEALNKIHEEKKVIASNIKNARNAEKEQLSKANDVLAKRIQVKHKKAKEILKQYDSKISQLEREAVSVKKQLELKSVKSNKEMSKIKMANKLGQMNKEYNNNKKKLDSFDDDTKRAIMNAVKNKGKAETAKIKAEYLANTAKDSKDTIKVTALTAAGSSVVASGSKVVSSLHLSYNALLKKVQKCIDEGKKILSDMERDLNESMVMEYALNDTLPIDEAIFLFECLR